MLFNLPFPVKIFATQGSQELAQNIYNASRPLINSASANSLNLGIATVPEFSNENLECQVDNVRGHFVVVIHTQVPPVSHRLLELFAMLDAIINAQCSDILLVFPYMPYSRSDRKNKPRISVMSKRLAHIFYSSFQIKRIILLEPHDSHIKHYFNPAADEITAVYLIADYLEKQFFMSYPKEKAVIVFPDAGAAKRFGQIPYLLQIPSVYIDKERPDDKERPVIKGVIGDVKNKICLVPDDEILTGSTSLEEAQKLKDEGAEKIFPIAVHGCLAEKNKPETAVIEKFENSPLIEKVIITDTIPVRHKLSNAKKFEVVSVVPLLAQAIIRTVCKESLTVLHQPESAYLYRSF